MDNNLLITGGTGFFGTALVEKLSDQLIRKKYDVNRVYLLSRSEGDAHRFKNKNFDWLYYVKGDIHNEEWWNKCKNITHVIHAAADSTNGPMLSCGERYDQIVNGTRKILGFSESQRIRNFLFISSGAVYARKDGDVDSYKETELCAPLTYDLGQIYGLAKRVAETECLIKAKELSMIVSVARCFSFIGHDLPMDKHFAIGNFIKSAILNEDIVINGNGSQIRSYLHQSDLANILIKMVFENFDGIYNVGSSEKVSIKRLAKLVVKASTKDIKVRIKGLATSSENEGRNVYVPNTDKLLKDLSIKPLNLEESISLTLGKLKRGEKCL